MKHTTAILVLAMLIMVSFSSIWATEITITETETENFTNYLPVNNWVNYTYSQQIYAAGEIGSALNITKIKFFWAGGGTGNSNNWTIYMGNTALAGFGLPSDWIPTAAMTQVYSGALTMPPEVTELGEWWEITLDSSFPYNGTDNLVIAIDENTDGHCSWDVDPMTGWACFGSDFEGGKFPGETKKSIYYSSDSDNPDPADLSVEANEWSTLSNVRNQIKLVGTEVTLPVELSSFTAVATQQNYAKLDWVTQTETGIGGYYLYRSESNNLVSAIQVSPLITANNTSSVSRYSYLDTEVNDGTWYYWLQSVEYSGSSNYYGCITLTITTGGDNPSPTVPLVTSLNKVFPNPFNPVTTINYDLSKSDNVKISIYNLKGELVKVLVSEDKQPGNYDIVWNGEDANNRPLASGTYIIRMIAGDKRSTQKALLIK